MKTAPTFANGLPLMSRRRLIQLCDEYGRARLAAEKSAAESAKLSALEPDRMTDDGNGGAILTPPVTGRLTLTGEEYAALAEMGARVRYGIPLDPAIADKLPRTESDPDGSRFAGRALIDAILRGERIELDDFETPTTVGAPTAGTSAPGRVDVFEEPDPGDSRRESVDCLPGEKLTIYGVALVFSPRYGGKRPTRVMVRQFCVRGTNPLTQREAISWALDLVAPIWPAAEWGALSQYDPPTGAVSFTTMNLPGTFTD